MKKIVVKLALVSLITLSASSHAQVDIDLTTASIGLAPQNSINIGNISYNGAKYDATLQWNPIAGRFDITTAVPSSGNANTKKCSLGVIGSNYGSFSPSTKISDITMTLDSSERSITIAYTPTSNFSYTDINKLWDFNIIQQGTQLYVTTDSGILSTNTALLTQLPDPKTGATVDWKTVPAGSVRYAKITKIASWFNFSLPISSIFDATAKATYSCL